MPAETAISVVIITHARPELLRAFLDSAFSGGVQPLEYIIGVNGEDPASQRLLEEYKGRIKKVALSGMCRGEARACLAGRALGRWLCFLDDDTVLPPGYFSRLAELIENNPDVSVFGGGQGLQPGAGYFESTVYSLLSSPWGGGPFTERFSPVQNTGRAGPEKFILCNLTLDGDFLRSHGFSFEGHLTSAEENLLLNRMARAGAKMVLSSSLNLIHRRRRDLGGFIRQVFGSGRGRAQISALYRPACSRFTLLPPGALLLGAVLGITAPWLLAWTGALYMAVSLCAAALCGAAPAVKPAVFALFPALHAAYAAGWLYGAVEVLFENILRRPRPGRCRCEEKP